MANLLLGLEVSLCIRARSLLLSIIVRIGTWVLVTACRFLGSEVNDRGRSCVRPYYYGDMTPLWNEDNLSQLSSE